MTERNTLRFTFPLKTVSEPNTRDHWSKKGKRTSQQRNLVHMAACGHGIRTVQAPWVVTVVRIAPSNGLDPHENLPASQKAVCDGLADALGLKSDRDPRVEWKYDQRRGKPGEYAIEVTVAHRDEETGKEV